MKIDLSLQYITFKEIQRSFVGMYNIFLVNHILCFVEYIFYTVAIS